jgi:histone deacetylase HOS2
MFKMGDFTRSIVQEYQQPLDKHNDFDHAVFQAKILREAQNNNIVRPKGYTVSWHSNPEIEKHHFGRAHPMKPWRLTLTKSLVMSYGMHTAMDSYVSRKATPEELADFHSEDYINYLTKVIGEPEPTSNPDHPHNLGGDDCPIFEGLFEYCSMYSGASLDAARKLISGQSDIAINWSGGLHHAKKNEASGFCYMNDIVVAILQLLRYHPRVLYIDIDVHHGDGVEEAFWSTNRVMTLSFHKYDPVTFFPGTGGPDSTGPKDERNPGAHHALNVPLNDGITDDEYFRLFERVVGDCVKHFRPTAIVLQCGADSLAGDRLGRFNLQVQGHGACVAFVKSLNIPLLLFGGGGYTPRNVARAWAHETSIAIGAKLHEDLPLHTPYRSHFRHNVLYPSLQEVLGGEPRRDMNTAKQVAKIIENITEQLRFVQHAPSVPMEGIPPDLAGIRDDIEERIRDCKDDNDELEDERQIKESGVGVAMEL